MCLVDDVLFHEGKGRTLKKKKSPMRRVLGSRVALLGLIAAPARALRLPSMQAHGRRAVSAAFGAAGAAVLLQPPLPALAEKPKMSDGKWAKRFEEVCRALALLSGPVDMAVSTGFSSRTMTLRASARHRRASSTRLSRRAMGSSQSQARRSRLTMLVTY